MANLLHLSEVTEFIKNGLSVKQDESAGGLPITRIETISHWEINPSKCGYAGLQLSDVSDRLIKEGDILFSHINSLEHLGKTAIYEGNPPELVHGMNLLSIRPNKDKVEPRYLLHLLRSKPVHAQVMRAANKSVNQASVSATNLKKIQVNIPELEEQKRIAKILDAADALRAKRRESLAQLDALLQSIFINMFGDPVTNPREWPVEPLGDVCDVRDGTHDSPKYVQEGFPLLTSKNFKNGEIDCDSANLISAEDYEIINRRSKVDIGDLVMPMIGTIGNPVLIERKPDFAIKNVALIKFSKGSPNNRFLCALLSSHFFDHITQRANRGGTQKFLSLGDLRKLPTPIPSSDIQEKFSCLVQAVKKKREQQCAHLNELDNLFFSLQQKAFSGEL